MRPLIECGAGVGPLSHVNSPADPAPWPAPRSGSERQVILVVIWYFGKAPVPVFARTWSGGFGPPMPKVADRVEGIELLGSPIDGSKPSNAGSRD